MQSDLILAYVPESEHLSYAEAQALALKRDRQAAEQLRLSVPDSVLPYTYDDELRRRVADVARVHGRTRSEPEKLLTLDEDLRFPALTPPLDPRRTWGKI